ncbi:hypothetical protein [Amycolatopsis decaplanina]|uniref:hypothetical protein n=1 Tax=Amycolatopsis decaplanina TaxID=208441 RepID=UPI001F242106|nr:hypothetical protein [Amycolatopsis decaplanina]
MRVSVPVLVVLGALGGVAFIPKVANHVGYALPGEKGLPYRVHYNGRDYRSDVTCAGARWCEDDRTPEQRVRPYCTSRAGLDRARGSSGTRLVKVDDVFALFGPSHPVFTAGALPAGETVTTVIVEASADCYLTYTLMGGP